MTHVRPSSWRSSVRPATLLVAAIMSATATQLTQAQLPTRLTDQEYWKMVTEFSEPGGFFRSENFVGNETSLQHVLTELTKRVPQSSVYLGVAPDQNYTFIVALKPKMAFIVDIRRQNLVQHLLYKALMELSPTRGEFVAKLFSRSFPSPASAGGSIDSILSLAYNTPPNLRTFEENFVTVRDHLVKKHGFALTDQDTVTLRHVYESFFRAGPSITYNYPSSGGGGGRGGGMPTYANMVGESDGQGAQRSYLASDAHYKTIRDFHMNNLLIPVVGDFAGGKALRAVGQYVRDKGAKITTFYTSNVEQYLFQTPEDWYKFYTNMSTLPLDSTSTLIRSAPDNNVRQAGAVGWPGTRSTMLMSYMEDIVRALRSGRITSYTDALGIAK